MRVIITDSSLWMVGASAHRPPNLKPTRSHLMLRQFSLVTLIAIAMCLTTMAYGHNINGSPQHPVIFANDELGRAVIVGYNKYQESIGSSFRVSLSSDLNRAEAGKVKEVKAANMNLTTQDLQYLTEHIYALERLYIGNNNLEDISPLSNLVPRSNQGYGLPDASGLQLLYAGRNNITDLSPLSGLTTLTTLGLAKNKNLSDISPLANLSTLQDLKLHKCSIGDISALSGLVALHTLHLNNQGNPEIKDASVIYETLSNNPWQTIKLEANPLNLASVNGLKALRVQHPNAWIDFNEEGAAAPSLAKGKITTLWSQLKAR